MHRQSISSKHGQGLIGLLVVIVIIGYLYNQGLLKDVLKPSTPANLPKAQAELPDLARNGTFKSTAQQVRAAVVQFQAEGGNRLPQDLAELHRATGLDLMKDPWEGHYYVEQGHLRCTGNPNISEKVW